MRGRLSRTEPWSQTMNPQRIGGIVLLVVGVILVVIGLNSSHSLADQVSNTFTGRFTEATTWYIVGGAGVALLGLLLTIARLGKTKA
jgi:branched-subunit amino acid permease